MLASAPELENQIQRWMSRRLIGDSVSDLAVMCQVEIDRGKVRAHSGAIRSRPGMEASFRAVIDLLQNPKSSALVNFADIEVVLALEKTTPYITLVSSPDSLQAALDESSPNSAGDHNDAVLRALEIITVREIVIDHYLEVAALQLGEGRQHQDFSKLYKLHPMPPWPENAWFFASGVVVKDFELECLRLYTPNSKLIRHKEALRGMFMDGLLDCFPGLQNDGAARGAQVREALAEMAKRHGLNGKQNASVKPDAVEF